MEVMTLTQEDMKSSRGGGKSWDHEAIQDFLNTQYDENIEEEDGDTVVIGVPLEGIGEEFYDGTVEDLKSLKHTNPDVVRQFVNNLPKAGFSEESQDPDRKYAVGTEKRSGTTIFKIELNPIE